MNVSIWLTRTTRSGGNFVKQLISKNKLTLSSYQALDTASFSSISLFDSHFSNSMVTTKDCGTYSSSFDSSSASFFLVCRYKSTKPEKPLVSSEDDDKITFEEDKGVHFPGGKIAFTSTMNFLPGSSEKRVQCYRVLDEDGYPVSSSILEYMSKEVGLKVYSGMVTLQTMDYFFAEAQRQGRLSLYVTSFGEEAIHIASAAALSSEDIILAQYREAGVLLWRGFTLQQFANQLVGNNSGHEKGRNMPIFFGSKKQNYFTISAPIATQLPQAVGVAYSLKIDQKDACVVAYFGDGATSEGDFHAAMNFAAVMDVPVVFICRNNGWAISTPVTDQFRSDGVVVKGQAYGIRSIRVDGNDALAIYTAVRSAREMAINEQRPILIEAMTYRAGPHSTADDSTKYQRKDEIEYWKSIQSPITRLRKWIERKGWWSDKEESELHIDLKKQMKHAIEEAEKEEKPPLKDMFTDIYEDLPSNLIEQERLLRETIKRHPENFPTDVSL